MNLKNLLNLKNISYFIVCLLFLISVFVQWYFWGYGEVQWGNLIPNIIAEFFGIIITSVILQTIISTYEKREAERQRVRQDALERQEAIRQKELQLAQEIAIKKAITKADYDRFKLTIGDSFKSLIFKIAEKYMHILTKKSPSFGSDRYFDIKNALDNIDMYITDDFVNIGIKVDIIMTKDFNVLLDDFFSGKKIYQSQEIPYQVFCKTQFKDYIKKEISEFLSRYIAIIPQDIICKIMMIDDIITHSPVLTTFYDANLVGDSTKRKIPIDKNAFKDVFVRLGNIIGELQDCAFDKN